MSDNNAANSLLLFGFDDDEDSSGAVNWWTAQHEKLRLPLGYSADSEGKLGDTVHADLGDPWASAALTATPNLGVFSHCRDGARYTEQLALRLAALYPADSVSIVTVDFTGDGTVFDHLHGIADHQFFPASDADSRAQMLTWIDVEIDRRQSALDQRDVPTHRDLIRWLGVAHMPYVALFVAGASGYDIDDLRDLTKLLEVGRSFGVVSVMDMQPFADENGSLGVYPTLREYLWSGVYLPTGDGSDPAAPELSRGEIPPQCVGSDLAVYAMPPLLVPVVVDTALIYDEGTLQHAARLVRERRAATAPTGRAA